MKNFFISKDEKITEKAFSQNLIISVVSILLCLVVLCSMTYAWYNTDVSSSQNTIKAGEYALSIKVTEGGTEVTHTEKDGYYQYALESGIEYKVTLSSTGTNSSNGYCKIMIDGRDPLYTNFVPVGEGGANPCVFTMTVSQNTTVRFDLRWGIYSGKPNVSNGGTLDVVISAETEG